MIFLKRILDFYINTSLHVAVAVVSLMLITKLSLNIVIANELVFFVFFGTVVGYNFLKYQTAFANGIFRIHKNLSMVAVTLSCLLAMIWSFIQLSLLTQKTLVTIGILVLIYPKIRRFASLKMTVVSLCVTLVTVFAPTIDNDFDGKYFMQRFLMVYCLLIPPEICDLTADSKTIKTLPQIVGVHAIKIIGFVVLTVFFALDPTTINLVVGVIVAILIHFSNENRSTYYCSFWVESVPIGWLLMLYTVYVFNIVQ